jgi:hypothetical protein
VIYPKITDMLDRKSEKVRRIWGSNIMRDLVKTQCSSILKNPEHMKQFKVFSNDHNFIFRAEMAEALGEIQKHSPE